MTDISDRITMEVPVIKNANRTMADVEILSRFGFHKPSNVTMPRTKLTRLRFVEMATFLDSILPQGRAKSLALTELENAEMWAIKAISEMDSVENEGPTDG